MQQIVKGHEVSGICDCESGQRSVRVTGGNYPDESLGEGRSGAGPTSAGGVASGGRVSGSGGGPSVQGHGDPPGVKGAQRVGREGALCSHTPSRLTLWAPARSSAARRRARPRTRSARTPVGRPAEERATCRTPAPPPSALRPCPSPSAPPPPWNRACANPKPAPTPRSPRGAVRREACTSGQARAGCRWPPGGRGPEELEAADREGRRWTLCRPREGPRLAACAPLSPAAVLAGTTLPSGRCGGRTRPLPAAARGRGSCGRPGRGLRGRGGRRAGRGGVGRGPLDAGRARGGWGPRARAPRGHAGGGERGQGRGDPRAGVPAAARRSPHKARGGPRPDCGDPGCLRPPCPGKAAREEWPSIQGSARSGDHGAGEPR